VVTFNNNLPRLDSTGTILDGHDSSVQKFAKDPPLYWMHTASYGLCKEPKNYGCDQTADHCGFQLDHNITIWTSPDLSSGSWKFIGYAIDWRDRPAGIVFRPSATYSIFTEQYILYWNWVAKNGTYMGYAAATSSTPAGPFTIKTDVVNVTLNNATWHAGDFHFFVDDDGTGYIIYSSQHWMRIEKLTDDFLASTGEFYDGFRVPSYYFVEAPAMFKRNGIYYALFGHCCCYCYQGSGIMVFTAQSPLGPFKFQGPNIACREPKTDLVNAIPTPGQGCLYGGSNMYSVTRSQQNFVITVDTPKGKEYVWTGDRWQQSPDGLKGHDPQYWTLLEFNADGSIRDVNWVDTWELDVI